MPTYIDGNWVDIGSFVIAAIYTVIQCKRTGQNLTSVAASLDFGKGLTLFPLLLLAVSIFSKPLLTELVDSSRATLSLAGIVALCAILEIRNVTNPAAAPSHGHAAPAPAPPPG